MFENISRIFWKFRPNKAKVRTGEIKDYSVNYFQLFQYSTFADKLCVLLGVIFSFVSGTGFPILMFSFGNSLGAISEYSHSIYDISMSPDNRTALFDKMQGDFFVFIIYSAGIGITVFTTAYLSSVLMSYSANKQIFRMRITFLEKVLHQDVSWFDLNQSGDLTTVLTQNLSKIEDGIGDLLATFLFNSTAIVAAIACSLIAGWKLAIAGFTILFLIVSTSLLITRFSTKFAEKEMDSYGKAGAVAEEVLSCIRTVVAYDGQNKEKTRYEKHLFNVQKNNIKRGLFNAFSKGIYLFCGYSGLGFIFWLGTKFMIEDRGLPVEEQIYTPSTVLMTFFMILQPMWNWEFLPPLVETILNAVGAGQKVFGILNSKTIIARFENKGSVPDDFTCNIVFDNVSFNYPSRPDIKILQGFNLVVNKGEIVALVGASGCGKTTCIQLIQRLYDPQEGQVFIDRVDIKNIKSSWLKQYIAVVSQEPVLFGTSIYENIRYGKLSASSEEIEEAAEKAKIHGFITGLSNGYNTVIGERGGQLSGGQKQKIAIARALIKKPKILLLDEATSALDRTSESEVQDTINTVRKDCTVIIVAHRLTTIQNADKIVFIRNGKAVEIGSHSELMEKRGYYSELINSQYVKNANESSEMEAIYSTIKPEENLPTISKDCEEIVVEESKPKNVFRKFLRLNSSEWRFILVGCIFSIFVGTAMPVYGMILGGIMEVISIPEDGLLMHEMSKYSLYFLLLGILLGASAFCQISTLTVAGERISLKIRTMLFDAMLKQEMNWFDRKENGVGALCTQLLVDPLPIQGVGLICQVCSIMLLSFTLSLYYEWRLALVVMVPSIVLFLIAYFKEKVSEYDAVRKRNIIEVSSKLAAEAIDNVKTVASLGCEEAFLAQYAKELSNYRKISTRTAHFRALLFAALQSWPIFYYPIGLWYGIKLIVNEHVPLGHIIIVCEIMMLGLWLSGNLMSICPNFQKSIAAAVKIIQLLERKVAVDNYLNPRKHSLEQETVDYSNVTFSYPMRPKKLVLNNFSLKISKGETVALVGPSGSGKSTVVQLLQRFYDPTSGEILLDGIPAKRVDLKSLRSLMGIVSQEPNLFNKTIAENISYGLNHENVEIDDVIKAAKAANIHNFIINLPQGYETRIGSKGSQLSGGQKQRIAIARALIRNPKILILDEATSALDNDSEKIVQEALRNARKGRTCITIAHRLSTIRDADLICVLKEGSIIEMGNHDALMKMKGFYYNFHQ